MKTEREPSSQESVSTDDMISSLPKEVFSKLFNEATEVLNSDVELTAIANRS